MLLFAMEGVLYWAKEKCLCVMQRHFYMVEEQIIRGGIMPESDGFWIWLCIGFLRILQDGDRGVLFCVDSAFCDWNFGTGTYEYRNAI